MTAPDARFALGLHRLLAADRDRSFAWSPYSVASALGVVGAGARGATRDELAAVLGDLDELGPALAAGAAFPADAAVTLGVANTLWADLTLPVADDYLAAVKAWPGGAARGADFRGNPDGSRQEINADVERSTRGLISDLIPAGLVDPDTRAVVVNALYLRAAWVKAFEKGATRPQPFRTPGGPVDVPTMRATRSLPYAARGGWTVVLGAGRGRGGGGRAAAGRRPAAGARPGHAGRPARRGPAAGGGAGAAAGEGARAGVAGRAAGRARGAPAVLRRGRPDRGDRRAGGAQGRRRRAQGGAHPGRGRPGGRGRDAMTMTRLAAITSPPRPIPVRVDRPFYLLIRHRPTATLHFLTQVTDPR